MCTDVMTLIRDSVLETITVFMCKTSTSSGGTNMMVPMSSEHLMEFFNYDIYNSVESCICQAFCDVTGGDIPVKVKPEFTEAVVKEVIDEINSFPTLTTKAAKISRERSKRTLRGVISTMKTFLTGRGHAVKTKFQRTRRDIEPLTVGLPSEDSVQSRKKTKIPLWRRLFCCCC